MGDLDFLRTRISAPGKVILHGEHSVVYGKSAVVAVINARNHLTFTENSSNEINLHFEGFKKHCKIPLNDINDILGKLINEENTEEYSTICLTAAQEFIESAPPYLTDFNEEQYKKTVTSVLYLLLGIFCEEGQQNVKNGFSIELTSELDLGAGLGSSASFGVCLASAFLSLARSKEIKEAKCFSINWKEIISKWAFNSEKIMHGKPSGIDNTICTYGGLIKFKKDDPFSFIYLQSTLHILLVNTKVPRSTAKMVKKLCETREQFPSVIDNIFDAMEEIAVTASNIYEDFLKDEQGYFDKIKRLFQINNDLLRSIGVSHERLDKIASIASTYGYSSKITGAGGGGYMIVLLPKNYKDSKEFKNLCEEFQKEGFEWKEETIGGKGVTIEVL